MACGTLINPDAFTDKPLGDPEGYDILRDLRERTGRTVRPLHMAYRPELESPLLTSDERRKVERLLNAPAMNAERSDLEAMLAAGRIGRFEQESLGVPLPGWSFYSIEQQANDCHLFVAVY
jgi:hypothetical protein